MNGDFAVRIEDSRVSRGNMITERYQGLNCTTPRRLRTHVVLTRTLRSYIEGNLLDLVYMNKAEPVLLEGNDSHGRDDVIEAHVAIIDQDFIFHIERSDQDDQPNRTDCLASDTNERP